MKCINDNETANVSWHTVYYDLRFFFGLSMWVGFVRNLSCCQWNGKGKNRSRIFLSERKLLPEFYNVQRLLEHLSTLPSMFQIMYAECTQGFQLINIKVLNIVFGVLIDCVIANV